MSESRLPRTTWIAWGLWVVALTALTAGWVVILTIRRTVVEESWVGNDVPFSVLLCAVFVTFATVGAVVAWRVPHNRVGWIFLAGGLLGAVNWFTSVYPLAALESGWPAPVAVAWLSIPTFFPSVILMVTLPVLLFPDGMLPSPRWRWVLVTIAASIVILGGAESLDPRALGVLPGVDNPTGIKAFDLESSPTGIVFAAIGFGCLVVSFLASAASLVTRYRRAEGETRLQLKWITFAAAWAGASLVTFFVLGTIDQETAVDLPAWADVVGWIALLGVLSIPVAAGLAILRYRLYDIDIVISRTFVYGSLAVFITVVYVGIVAGLGALLGGGDEPNPVLAIGATAVVAIAFQPVRRWLQRVANRLVYGKRASPYEVLSDFSRRVAATDDSLLTDVAHSLVDGTGAEFVEVWVESERGAASRAAVWPASAGALSNNGAGGNPTRRLVLPVEDESNQLGSLVLIAPRGQRLSEDDRRLAGEVASGMSLALRNQRLTHALRTHVEELRESRHRIVAVQDETRRHLERDLHDGAQQQLVATKVKVGLARQLAAKSGTPETMDLLQRASQQADDAIEAMRDFARGVYPPLLEAEGLGPALTAQLRRMPSPIAFNSDGLRRYPHDVESTVYFCVLETLANTSAHAAASGASVLVTETPTGVTFQVSNEGSGIDPTADSPRFELMTLSDRVEAIGGTLSIESAPGSGMTIRGEIPIAATAPAVAP